MRGRSDSAKLVREEQGSTPAVPTAAEDAFSEAGSVLKAGQRDQQSDTRPPTEHQQASRLSGNIVSSAVRSSLLQRWMMSLQARATLEYALKFELQEKRKRLEELRKEVDTALTNIVSLPDMCNPPL
jgi:hypothetical protein